jgi:hypothetical protein
MICPFLSLNLRKTTKNINVNVVNRSIYKARSLL